MRLRHPYAFSDGRDLRMVYMLIQADARSAVTTLATTDVIPELSP